MGYPTSSDVTALLSAAGISGGDSLAAAALAGVIAAFERGTGWRPLLKDTVDASRYFDTPCPGTFGCVLELRHGLQTLTELKCGVGFDGTGGTVMTQGEGFLLEPSDGGIDGRPYTQVRFIQYPFGNLVRSIKITGKWGYCDDVPDDISQAIIRKAASDVCKDLSLTSETMSRIKEGPVEYQFLADQDSTRVSREWDRVISRHMRVTF
jgi:hypothetical protein